MEDKEKLTELDLIELAEIKEKEQQELLEDLMWENQECY